VLVENLQIKEFLPEQLSLETIPDLSSQNRELPNLTAGTFRLKATTAEIQLMASATAGILRDRCPIPFRNCECAVGLNPYITLDEVNIDFQLEMVDESNGRIKSSDVRMEGLTLNFQPKIEGICDYLGEFLAKAATLGDLEDSLFDKFKGGFLDFIEQTMEGQLIPFSRLTTLQLPSGSIVPSLNMTDLKVTTEDVYATLATSFTSSLKKPDFRAGNTLGTTISATRRDVQEVDVQSLASAHVSFLAVNDLLRSIWYTAWANMATNEDAVSSKLCFNLLINQERSATNQRDPCPFLPIMSTSTSSDNSWWLLKLMYPFGFHSSYVYSFVVPPPTLDFVDSEFQGAVEATMFVQGVPRGDRKPVQDLFTLTGVVDWRSPMPSYDTMTQKVYGMEISSLALRDAKMNFIENAFFGWIFDPNNFVNQNIIELLLPEVTKQVNVAVQNFFQRTPLAIPVIPGIPMREKAVQLQLVDTQISAVGSTSETPGFINFDSNVALNIIDNPDLTVAPVQLRTLNVTEVEKKMFSKVQQIAVQEQLFQAKYTYKFDDPVSGSSATKQLSWSNQLVQGEPQLLVEVIEYNFTVNNP